MTMRRCASVAFADVNMVRILSGIHIGKRAGNTARARVAMGGPAHPARYRARATHTRLALFLLLSYQFSAEAL